MKNQTMTYLEFLQQKVEMATESGFDVKDEEINPALKPHQRDAVRWALKGGCRALFESFGLGKTIQEIEFCKQVVLYRKKAARRSLCCRLGRKRIRHFWTSSN